jgi:phosphatidylglycerol---prolipoprotein diacylglyceryl transferase
MGDTAVLGLILGQVMGRWGNFMNREAFGEYTNNLFAMALPVDAVRFSEVSDTMIDNIIQGTNYIQVHPTFLYESLWNLCLLGFLLLYKKHKRFQGEIVVLYLGIYGLGRFWVEGLRTDQLLLGSTDLAVSQVLATLLVVFAIVVELGYTFLSKKKEKLTRCRLKKHHHTICSFRVLRGSRKALFFL